MNIIAAIKSGKKFKRKDWDDYMFVDSDYFLNNLDSIKREFLLADDWEVEEAAVSITRNAFYEAYEQALRDVYINNIDYHQIGALVILMARKLGL